MVSQELLLLLNSSRMGPSPPPRFGPRTLSPDPYVTRPRIPSVGPHNAAALPRPTTQGRREHDERGPNGVRVDVDERLSLKCLRGLSLQAKRGRLEKARQRRT